jgi:transcriptional regulator with XRE-family HTH domain
MTLPSISKEAALADLRELIRIHHLTQREVAELACVSRKTVESWLASPDSPNHRTMPVRHLRTIRYALRYSKP